jgi:ABC-type transport system involved in cytochrome c biogenesis permease component
MLLPYAMIGKNQIKSDRYIIWPLQSLNFFMADIQAGIGPFLSIFLLANGWKSGLIGSVMTIGGVAGMLMTAPAGALIVSTRRKRMYVIIPGIIPVMNSAVISLSQNLWWSAYHRWPLQ